MNHILIFLLAQIQILYQLSAIEIRFGVSVINFEQVNAGWAIGSVSLFIAFTEETYELFKEKSIWTSNTKSTDKKLTEGKCVYVPGQILNNAAQRKV